MLLVGSQRKYLILLIGYSKHTAILNSIELSSIELE